MTIKISIIIAVYNGEKYIGETLDRITNQTYDNIEIIVVDGGSTDSTHTIISKYRDKITHYISEPDKGISDAFNKGVKLSSGDYVNFQGDGDGFINPESVESALLGVDVKTDTFVSCKVARVTESGDLLYTSDQPRKFNKASLLFKMSLPHQGLLTHRRYFDEFGYFDINNKYCMDYEHLLRAYHNFPIVRLQNVTLAQWRADGLGNNREIEIYGEYDFIKRKHKVAPVIILDLINLWILSKHFIKRAFLR